MLFRGIVKNYTADLILRTKFKKIIGMKEKFAQNMEVPVSLMEFLLQTQGSFGGFFCFKFYILRRFLGEQDFKSSFVSFLGDKIRNSNVFLRMCFRMCFPECVSANMFPICFQLRKICFQEIFDFQCVFLTKLGCRPSQKYLQSFIIL